MPWIFKIFTDYYDWNFRNDVFFFRKTYVLKTLQLQSLEQPCLLNNVNWATMIFICQVHLGPGLRWRAIGGVSHARVQCVCRIYFFFDESLWITIFCYSLNSHLTSLLILLGHIFLLLYSIFSWRMSILYNF